jgi:ABC-type multidrug transport system fused ATPase/permease subunit
MAALNPNGGRGPATALFDAAAWSYFERCAPGTRRRLLLLGLVGAAQSLLLLPVLLLIRYAVDQVIPGHAIGMLVWIGAAIFALRAANGGTALWLRAAQVRVLRRATQRVREDLLDRLYRMSRASHTRLDLDTTHTRIVLDTARLDEMCHAVVARLIPAMVSAVVLVAVLGFLNVRLLLLLVAVAPLLLLSMRLTSGLVKRHVFTFQRAFETFSNGMQFVLQHMDLTLTQGYEVEEKRRRTADLERLSETSERMAMAYSVHNQLQGIVVALCGVMMLVMGGAAVAAGTMTIGQFLAFWVAAGLLNQQVTAVVGSVPGLISGNESMITLHHFAESGEPQPYQGREALRFDGRIELDRVEFGYGGTSVVRDVTFTIAPGSRVAVVGPNGAGKSTLLYLILGLYRPQKGELRADGVPYEDLDLLALRRQVGVVMQHPAIFAGTVRDNITYGSPEATDEDIVHAARLALADGFIGRLPKAYDTPIGEDGVLLSGGEVQRIAITRALLRRPKLLILDEPTNHLEHAAIRGLLDHLSDLEERPAVLLISHDREVLSFADTVYRVEAGRVRLELPPPARTAGVAVGASR